METAPCHAHFVAVELAKLWHDISVGTFEGGCTILGVNIPPFPNVESAASRIESFCASFGSTSRSVFWTRHELALTSFFVREVDRAVFGHADCQLAALHQFTVFPERDSKRESPHCDLTIVRLLPGMDLRSVGFGDGKVTKLTEAIQETKAYACSYFDYGAYSFQLSIPFTENNLEVGLCLPAIGKDLYVHLARVALKATEVQHLLRFIFAASHFLAFCPNASPEHPLSLPCPSATTAYERMIGGRTNKSLFTERVFCTSHSDGGELMAKYFDSEQDSSSAPNVDIVSQILGSDYLPGMRCETVVPGRLQVLLYQRIGTHAAQWAVQFRKIFQDLCALHEAGYIHGDVRDANMVFWDKDARLIDFDMLHLSYYPPDFNRNVDERHGDARASQSKDTKHDLFALGVVMGSYTVLGSKRGELQAWQLQREKFLGGVSAWDDGLNNLQLTLNKASRK